MSTVSIVVSLATLLLGAGALSVAYSPNLRSPMYRLFRNGGAIFVAGCILVAVDVLLGAGSGLLRQSVAATAGVLIVLGSALSLLGQRRALRHGPDPDERPPLADERRIRRDGESSGGHRTS